MISAWELIKAGVARWTSGGPAVSDGIGTKRYMSYILAQSGVPVGLAPNGTIATNGTVTLGTALSVTYSNGIWLRFPANAVVGDTTGGIYWCVMSSTTVGTVYAGKIDTASAFTPYIGSTSGGAVTGSNSAYTQTTSAFVLLANITMPGNAIGNNGSLHVSADFLANSNANSKAPGIYVDGTAIYSATLSSWYSVRALGVFRNKGSGTINSTGYQNSLTGLGSQSSQAVGLGAVDTTQDTQLYLYGKLAVATDYIVLDAFSAEVKPS